MLPDDPAGLPPRALVTNLSMRLRAFHTALSHAHDLTEPVARAEARKEEIEAVTKTTFKQCDVERAMSEPPHKRARRRPTLSAALKAAKDAGRPVKSAVVERWKESRSPSSAMTRRSKRAAMNGMRL